MQWIKDNRLWLIIALFFSTPVWADIPTFELEIREHLFYPSVLIVPANTKIKLIIYNRDKTPEEFESNEFNREKVITGEAKVIMFVGPLVAGDYPFFGGFFPKTAQGILRVEE